MPSPPARCRIAESGSGHAPGVFNEGLGLAARDEVRGLRRLAGRPGLSDRADLRDTRAPAPAGGRPGLEMGKEGEPLVADPVDQRVVVVTGLNSGRNGAQPHDAIDAALVERTEGALQPDDRLLRAGFHSTVEDDIVDAGGKMIALNLVPILPVVDFEPLLAGDGPHGLRGQALAHAIGGCASTRASESCSRDATMLSSFRLELFVPGPG